MYEAKERQRFLNDAQYLREMQHKMDSDYQACLRKQEQTREQSEKKREQRARQELRQANIASISAVRSYERPWISRLPVNRQASSDEVSGCETKSTIRSPGNKTEAKFPAIDKTSVKQKQKPSTFSKKPEKSGPSPKRDTSAFQKPVISRRQQISQRSLLENPDPEMWKRVEGKGRKTPMLHGTVKAVRGSDPQEGSVQKCGPAPRNKKKAPEKRSLVPSSKITIDSKSLDRELRKGKVLPSAESANGPSVSSDPSNSNLPPIKNAPVRLRENDFYAMLCSNVDGSIAETESPQDAPPLGEELPSVNLSSSPSLEQSSQVHGMSLTQEEQPSCETGIGDNGRKAESGPQLLGQHNVAVNPTAEQPSLGQRKTRDYKQPCALEENPLEEADKNEGDNSTLTFRSGCAESRPENATVDGRVGHSSCSEDWLGNNLHGRERQACENHQRCSAPGHISLTRPIVARPSVHSVFNLPGSLAQPENRMEVAGHLDASAVCMQVTELTGPPRFTARRQLSPIRARNSFSGPNSCQSASPPVSPCEEESSLPDDSVSNSLSSVSSGAASHDEDNFLNSHGSSSSSPSSSSSATESSPPSIFRANFTAHLHMGGPLPEQVPIFLTVSDLRNPSNFVSPATACTSPDTKEVNKPETDPEKLKQLQESLLAEDSEEEGDQCRICQIAGGSLTNPLLEPCGCGGSLRFVHQECLKTWLKAKIKSGAELGAVNTCELCKQSLKADLDDFNVNDYYRNHQQSRAQNELMNSGLYLVLLLHLYEQRFAELMRLNYNQASRQRLSRQPRTEENQNSANSGNSG